MRKLLAIALLISGTLFMVSCGEDDTTAPTFDDPTVSITSAPSSVDNGSTGNTVVFAVTVDADLTLTDEDLTLTASTNLTNAAAVLDGTTVTVTFDATTTAGAASIRLSVEDSEGGSANETAVFTVNEIGDNSISISLIPATANIAFQADLAAVPYQVDGLDGITAFTVSVNGGTAADFAAVTGDDLSTSPTSIGGSTSTFTVPWATLIALGGNVGANAIVFEATDADGDTDQFTHTLTVGSPEVVVVDANISETASWTSDKVYELATRVTVLDGGTLNIEAGTVIKGRAGQGESSTALLVARGGTINATGTADAPIIFTSVSDQLTPGQIVSPNLEADVTGLWGGVIILGNDLISVSAGTENQVDGIPPSDTNGLYGGSAADDNSGTFRYVSIRHAGTDIGDGDEINGLTLGAVGAATDIAWIEIVANKDDGIEWFGGSVSINGALVWNNGDDALDTDEAWNGDLTEFIVVNPGKSGFELDGPEGEYINATKPNHTFSNGTVYIPAAADFTIDFDDESNVNMSDIYFYGYPDTSPAGVEEYNNMISFAGSTSSASGFEYTFPSGAAYTAAEVFLDIPGAELTTVAANANTVGPDATNFGWTFAGASGALAGIGL